jgi:hypothetical protein
MCAEGLGCPFWVLQKIVCPDIDSHRVERNQNWKKKVEKSQNNSKISSLSASDHNRNKLD